LRAGISIGVSKWHWPLCGANSCKASGEAQVKFLHPASKPDNGVFLPRPSKDTECDAGLSCQDRCLQRSCVSSTCPCFDALGELPLESQLPRLPCLHHPHHPPKSSPLCTPNFPQPLKSIPTSTSTPSPHVTPPASLRSRTSLSAPASTAPCRNGGHA
jgi:hypothetical protein